MDNRGRTPTYVSWMNMMQRCSNANRDHHQNYIDRGIGVCERWRKFNVFLSDMGERPVGHTLDRVDNANGYCKENCKWSTQVEQCNNRGNNHIIVAFGERQTLAQWTRDHRCVVGYHTLKHRIRRGFSPEDAITTSVFRHGHTRSNP